jgi:ATP-dependent Clp protease ATP-binding subunit ClpA
VFERFTDRARRAVTASQEEARSLGHGYIGTEHLLLGLLREEDGIAARVLKSVGVSHDGVRADLESVVGRGTAPTDDAEALRAIGIDLDAVRASVERAFGPGALERAPTPRRPRPGARRRARRRRRCGYAVPGGHIPFTPRSKKVLELALRESLRLRHGYIGTEHILLALVDEGEGLAAAILVKKGVSLPQLRRRVLAALGKVA